MEKVIKFQAVQISGDFGIEINLSQFKKIKKDLLDKNLIGKIRQGKFAGYDCGNISIRDNNSSDLKIIITGSQTSSKPIARLEDFCLIENYNPEKFWIEFSGTASPSSETPLHREVYKSDSQVRAIIHAHIMEDDPFYNFAPDFFLKNNLPFSRLPSKTKEIGIEIADLIKNKGFGDIIGMLNHDGGFGLLSAGESLENAAEKLIKFCSNFNNL